jgi:hypothetical protein
VIFLGGGNGRGKQIEGIEEIEPKNIGAAMV